MLKTMRKNVQSLKSILWIVIATFIVSIFVIWGGAGRLGDKTASDTIAVIAGRPIRTEAYFNALRNRIESLKSQMNEINRSFIEQLGLPQQVLNQLIDQTLLFSLAKGLGVRASDEEVAAKIKAIPGLQQDGQFVGYENYKRVLQMNRINLTDFESSLRQEIILDKTVQLVTAGVTATPDEVWDGYQAAKSSAKIEYLVLENSKLELETKPGPADIRAYFDAHASSYTIPERREAAYVFFKNDDLKKEVELSESEIGDYYKANEVQFQTPEKVKVSRIFIPFTGGEKAVVESTARDLAARIKAGEDFAALARSFSKDDKAATGGDWGLYDWKSLAQAEQDAAAKLDAGQASDPLTLDNGMSILKVTEKTPAATTPLEDAKPQIRSMIQEQKARQMATDRMAKFAKDAARDKSLEAAAKKSGLKVEKTGLLKSGEALGDIDASGAISTAIFPLKDKEISAPIYTYTGVALAEMQKTEAPRSATFDEVKGQVETDVTGARKKDLALNRIKEIRAKLTDKNWEDVAQKYKVEIKTVDEHKKEQYIGVIGENKKIDAAAFSLPLKQISEPIAYEGGYAVVRVLERKEAVKEEFEKEKETEMANLIDQKKNKFLQAYLSKIRAAENFKIKPEVYSQITEDVLSRYGEK
jgi:peptidyl-prolyl cis-trans isomerase D